MYRKNNKSMKQTTTNNSILTMKENHITYFVFCCRHSILPEPENEGGGRTSTLLRPAKFFSDI